MHSIFSKAIYTSAARVRNPSLLKEYERLRGTERLSREALLGVQMERAAELLRFAYRHSPYYTTIFRQHGFDPSRFESLQDLQQLPIQTKQDLIANNAAIRSSFRFDKIFIAETSGTSGEALEFPRNERWDSINRAHLMRAYDMYGVRPWDRNGYLWGYNLAPDKARRVQLLDDLQNRFRLFRYEQKAIEDFARKLRNARFLSGYSSMVYEVAKAMNSLGLQAPSLRMVKGTSEMILDIYQAEAQKAFGQKIVSEYGAAESGLIAFECPSGSMHVNLEDVIVETMEDGSIVVTNLASLSFPVIRYRLGDVVTLSDESCACGRQHPLVKEVLGRRGGTVIGKSRRFPALTFYYVFKNIATSDGVLLNYRVVQQQAEKCTVSIEGRENALHDALVRAQLAMYFGDDIHFEVEYVAEFPKGKKKTQYFESRL